jgi:hypothetical protein
VPCSGADDDTDPGSGLGPWPNSIICRVLYVCFGVDSHRLSLFQGCDPCGPRQGQFDGQPEIAQIDEDLLDEFGETGKYNTK